MPALTKNLTGKVQKWFKNGLKMSNEKSKGESTDVEDKEVSPIDDSSLCDDSVITGSKAVNLIEDPTKGIEERSPSLNGSKMSNEKSNLKSTDVEDKEVSKINDSSPCDRKSPLSTLLFVLVISILGYFCYISRLSFRLLI